MEELYKLILAVAAPLIVAFLKAKIPKEPIDKNQQVSWISWIAACSVGGGIGGALSGIFSLSAGGLFAAGFGNWALFGASIGVMQWVVLRNYIKVSNYWALLTMVGWLLFAFFQATEFLPNFDPRYLGWTHWTLVGLFVGVLQWTYLRKSLEKSAIWILANGIAWVIAGTVVLTVGKIIADAGLIQNPVQFFVAWVISWSVIGLIGGLILRFFLIVMQPIQAEEDT